MNSNTPAFTIAVTGGLVVGSFPAWPAVAFTGLGQNPLHQARRTRRPGADSAAPAVAHVPGDGDQTVRAACAARQPSRRRDMDERSGLSRRKVSHLVPEVTISANGYQPRRETA